MSDEEQERIIEATDEIWDEIVSGKGNWNDLQKILFDLCDEIKEISK